MPAPERGSSLFDQLTSFENLYHAAARARRGKRFNHATACFELRLAENLLSLRDELISGQYHPGPYHTFSITDPAPRFISAAPYRDRVVHHALCNVIEPLFERSFNRDVQTAGPGPARLLAGRTASGRSRGGMFQFPAGRRPFFRPLEVVPDLKAPESTATLHNPVTTSLNIPQAVPPLRRRVFFQAGTSRDSQDPWGCSNRSPYDC